MSATLTQALVGVRGPNCFEGTTGVAAYVPRRSVFDRYFPAGASHDEVRRNAAHVCRELEVQRGDRLEPEPGCRIDRMSLGQAWVHVEWTRDESEPANVVSGDPVIEAVFINGLWTDPKDWATDKQMQQWADEAGRILAREPDAFEAEQVAA